MLQQLINHSPDLKQLRDEGYELEVKDNFLLVHHVPYVNHSREIKFGTLVSELSLATTVQTAKPNTHVINFIGEHPCDKNGTLISPIQHASNTQQLAVGLIINHTFSNKPPNGYDNYYQKFTRYIDIISAHALSIDSSITAKTFKVVADNDNDSVFQYIDTHSSRANINMINEKFVGQRIGIIGLGGTGAYILDLVSKSKVKEIHLFDGDVFHVHNAFRSPGAASIEELETESKKVDYFSKIYSNMHKNIIAHPNNIDELNIDILKHMSFVFISIDNNLARKFIIDFLNSKNIPFIDVGLGVNVVDSSLIGTVRLTAANSNKKDHIKNRIPISNDVENEYSTNIQIADLNLLNAAFAVIKWKKMCGFYQDLEQEYFSCYVLNTSQLLNEDIAA